MLSNLAIAITFILLQSCVAFAPHRNFNELKIHKRQVVVPPIRASIKDVVKDDNIFRIHSLIAGGLGLGFFFGSSLLYETAVPALGPLYEVPAFVSQCWSVFILGVAAITYQAPSFPPQVKRVIRRVYGTQSLVVGLLFLKNLVDYLGNPLLGAYAVIADGSSALVLLPLAYGYFVADSTANQTDK